MIDKKNKILVVDDECDVVKTLKNFLSRRGFEVNSALSGEEALSALEKNKTDLILLDIRMPGLQGTEVARIVKERYPYIKIIVVTAYPETLKSLGGQDILEDVLIKPIGLWELNNKLLEALGDRETTLLEPTVKQDIKTTIILVKMKILFALLNLLAQNYRDN